MRLFSFFVVITVILTGCATPPPPRPIAHWVERENSTAEGRINMTDVKYDVVSTKSVRVSGRVLCQQKFVTYSEDINSGRKRNYRAEWRTCSASQIRLKSIAGSFTASLDNEERFEYLLSIQEHDNMYFQAPDNLPSGFTLSKELLTVDICSIQGLTPINFPCSNFTHLPIVISEKSVSKQPSFDLDESVRNFEKRVCTKVVLKFENMISRLPENPLVTVMGISGPTKENLIEACMNFGYTKSQAVSIIGEFDCLTPDQKVSDSGQMMVFKGIRKATYGIEARNAGTHFTRLDFIIKDEPITEKTVLLSPDQGKMLFEKAVIKGGAFSQ